MIFFLTFTFFFCPLLVLLFGVDPLLGCSCLASVCDLSLSMCPLAFSLNTFFPQFKSLTLSIFIFFQLSPALCYWFLVILDNMLAFLLASDHFAIGFFSCPPVGFNFFWLPQAGSCLWFTDVVGNPREHRRGWICSQVSGLSPAWPKIARAVIYLMLKYLADLVVKI